MGHRRERLIARRKHLDFTQESLANEVGVSVSAVTSWERGTRLPAPGARRPLAGALQVSLDGLDHLLEIDNGDDIPVNVVATQLSHYDSLVQGAGELREVELGVIPHLLQSPGYAGEVERAGELRRSPADVQRLVALRIKRQEALFNDAPLRLQVLLPAWVLTDDLGAPRVMAEQLERIIELIALPNVDVRMLGPGKARAVVNGFGLLTKRGGERPWMAVTPDLTGVAAYHEDPGMVAKFVRRFDHLAAAALSPEATLVRIKELRQSYTRVE